MNNDEKVYVPIADGFGWLTLLLGAIGVVTIIAVLGSEFK